MWPEVGPDGLHEANGCGDDAQNRMRIFGGRPRFQFHKDEDETCRRQGPG